MAEAVGAMIPNMTLVDWLDDLTVRFLLNLPPAELSSVPRICFQIEEAQWFYEDFIRPTNPALPGMNLRQFLLALFQHCPLLQGFDAAQHMAVYEEFLAYKTRVPVRGAILMDDSMEKVLLVRGWKKGSSWSFPRGKINKDEPDLDCAIREVYEETGFDVRAAGLVESNQRDDGGVKAIDVTMKDQHMKLFIFRGVPLDTHFEPKTRKEISKIQWYNVRDLPGFKKQNAGHGNGQGEAQSTKFFMVAPFLGHLKKWIGQQRRNETAAVQAHHFRGLSATNDGFQTTATEDEGGTENELTADFGSNYAERPADELKRLLSIGVSTQPAFLAPIQHPQVQTGASHTKNLLAMLKGSEPTPSNGAMPHTPFQQIDPAFPSQVPETPQPYHPRRPQHGIQEQQANPQFSYLPQHLQRQQHEQERINFSGAASGVFGSNSSGDFQGNIQPPNPNLPPQMQHQKLQPPNQQHGLPNHHVHSNIGPQAIRQANTAASSLSLYQQMHTLHDRHFDNSQSSSQQPHLNINYAGGPPPLASPMELKPGFGIPASPLAPTSPDQQPPIGSEPAVPEPSKLPQLNPQSLRLLDAFRTGSAKQSQISRPSAEEFNDRRLGGQQQKALLDLFKKPLGAQQSSRSVLVETPKLPRPPSPAPTDTTEKPPPLPKSEQRSTFRETTPTLPSDTKAKPPVPPTVTTQPTRITRPEKAQRKQSPKSRPATHAMQTVIPGDVFADRPKSRGQLFDPSNPGKFTQHSSPHRKQDQGTSASQVAILPRPTSKHGPHSPKALAKAKQKQGAHENGPPTPQFSILQRPGSSAGKAPRLPIPQSPLRNEAAPSGFQPRVLTKQKAALGHVTLGSDVQGSIDASDKKDQLLSLFGKAPLAFNPTPTEYAATPISVESRHEDQQKNALLGLFTGASAPSQITARSPEPPPAPQLLPERNPSSQGQPAKSHQKFSQQQLMLNLLSKSTTSTNSSPGTPISPFTLGTPVVPDPRLIHGQTPLSIPFSESRTRIGSSSSVTSNITPTQSGQQTPSSATPTNETKGFLLNYLNGVVEKEGNRSAKTGSRPAM